MDVGSTLCRALYGHEVTIAGWLVSGKWTGAERERIDTLMSRFIRRDVPGDHWRWLVSRTHGGEPMLQFEPWEFGTWPKGWDAIEAFLVERFPTHPQEPADA